MASEAISAWSPEWIPQSRFIHHCFTHYGAGYEVTRIRLQEGGALVAVNVMVLGLDEHNERILRDLPDAAQYRFHPLLSVEELLGVEEVALRDLLDKAVRQLEDFDGSQFVNWRTSTDRSTRLSDSGTFR